MIKNPIVIFALLFSLLCFHFSAVKSTGIVLNGLLAGELYSNEDQSGSVIGDIPHPRARLRMGTIVYPADGVPVQETHQSTLDRSIFNIPFSGVQLLSEQPSASASTSSNNALKKQQSSSRYTNIFGAAKSKNEDPAVIFRQLLSCALWIEQSSKIHNGNEHTNNDILNDKIVKQIYPTAAHFSSHCLDNIESKKLVLEVGHFDNPTTKKDKVAHKPEKKCADLSALAQKIVKNASSKTDLASQDSSTGQILITVEKGNKHQDNGSPRGKFSQWKNKNDFDYQITLKVGEMTEC